MPSSRTHRMQSISVLRGQFRITFLLVWLNGAVSFTRNKVGDLSLTLHHAIFRSVSGIEGEETEKLHGWFSPGKTELELELGPAPISVLWHYICCKIAHRSPLDYILCTQPSFCY